MGNLSGLSSGGGVGSLIGGGLFGEGTSEIDKLLGYLQSRTILQKVIDKFNLTDYYEIEKFTRDKTLKAFSDDVNYELTENGFIAVSMIHRSPDTAAAISNYLVEIVDSLNRSISTMNARNYREFVEKRYKKNVRELNKAQDKMEEFQEKHGIYAIPEQLEIGFKAITEVESRVLTKEIELKLAKLNYGKDSQNYEYLSEELKLLEERLNNIRSGKYNREGSVAFLPMDDLPQLQKKYLSVYREIEIQNKLLEFTLPIYEQAVMEEQKNMPTVVTLDKAIPPEMKDSPKRAFIVISVFMLFLFFHLPFVYRAEKANIQEDPKNIYESKEKKFFNITKKIYRLKI